MSDFTYGCTEPLYRDSGLVRESGDECPADLDDLIGSHGDATVASRMGISALLVRAMKRAGWTVCVRCGFVLDVSITSGMRRCAECVRRRSREAYARRVAA